MDIERVIIEIVMMVIKMNDLLKFGISFFFIYLIYCYFDVVLVDFRGV